MREIKFRGKCSQSKRWVHGYIVKVASPCGLGWVMHIPAKDPDDNHRVVQVDPDTVGQYTGLKDKNGVEIYEWDIIRHHDDILSEVFYNTAHCAYLLRDINGHRNKCVIDRLGAYSSLWIEVIGNIHDNPELLGGAE